MASRYRDYSDEVGRVLARVGETPDPDWDVFLKAARQVVKPHLDKIAERGREVKPKIEEMIRHLASGAQALHPHMNAFSQAGRRE